MQLLIHYWQIDNNIGSQTHLWRFDNNIGVQHHWQSNASLVLYIPATTAVVPNITVTTLSEEDIASEEGFAARPLLRAVSVMAATIQARACPHVIC